MKSPREWVDLGWHWLVTKPYRWGKETKSELPAPRVVSVVLTILGGVFALFGLAGLVALAFTLLPVYALLYGLLVAITRVLGTVKALRSA